jgi:uncharacterized RDD family membrane protein YckC
MSLVVVPSEPATPGTPAEPGTPAGPPPVRYVGLATRAIAMVIDAAAINLLAIIAGIGASLILSLFHLPTAVKVALAGIGAAVYVLWTVGYFIVFWSTTGQTPGDRVMQFRVVTENGERLKPRRALVRVAGSFLAALPLFAGYFLILFDDKRRGFQDRLARTVVIEAPKTSYIAARRAANQADGGAAGSSIASSRR